MSIQEIARKIRAGLWINYDEIVFLLDQYEQLDKTAQDAVQRLIDRDKLIEALQAQLSDRDQQHKEDQEDIYRLQDRIDSTWGIWGDVGKGRRVYLG
jgi:chromosome segregation ATPase